jgi:methyl-accepting chemotaxis protein
MPALNINDRAPLLAISSLYAAAIAYGAAFSGVALPLWAGGAILAAALGVAAASQGQAEAAASASLADAAGGLLRADGVVDFAVANASSSNPVAAQLINALQHIQRSRLQVNCSADAMAMAAGEIAGGNADLRQRTEQTASSQQRTASSVQELTTHVRQSAESARTGSALAGTAAEVAQRSANAAREIKSLIGASVERVEAGTRQVNSAVGDLDRMTRQNAALVEESAAAAEGLKDQAGRLAALVDTFRLQPA